MCVFLCIYITVYALYPKIWFNTTNVKNPFFAYIYTIGIKH